VGYKVQLVTTKPNYGGRRWWFICPIVRADERGAEAGEHQRLPALPDGRAAGGLADVLSFLSGQIGFSLQGMTSHALSVKRVGPPEAMQFNKLPALFHVALLSLISARSS
jgi:hypothetical protein